MTARADRPDRIKTFPRPAESPGDFRACFPVMLKRWRRKNYLPLKRVAADLHLSVNTLSAWEQGKRFPTGRHFDQFVAYTGEPPCHFVCSHAEQCRPGGCLRAAMLLEKTKTAVKEKK